MKSFILFVVTSFSLPTFADPGVGACYTVNAHLVEQPSEHFDLCKELISSNLTDESVKNYCQEIDPSGATSFMSECPRENFLAGCSFGQPEQSFRVKLYFYKNKNVLSQFVSFCRLQGGTAF